jgi:hypothetical protein
LFPVIFLLAVHGFPGGKVSTKILVRVVSKDAKVIGSGVGGASVRIVNAETGETLAGGKQEGGTGDTDRIMVKPRARGETVYGTPGAASFTADIPLDRPTRAEIRVEAPLGFPQAMQRGSKTVTLIPGKDIKGEGVIIELDGLIVNILNPASGGIFKRGEEVKVRAEVKML